MIELRKGQTFYDEKTERFVTIAQKVSDKPYLKDNDILCYTHNLEGIELELFSRSEILNMEFVKQADESYMKILKEEIYEQYRND